MMITHKIPQKKPLEGNQGGDHGDFCHVAELHTALTWQHPDTAAVVMKGLYYIIWFISDWNMYDEGNNNNSNSNNNNDNNNNILIIIVVNNDNNNILIIIVVNNEGNPFSRALAFSGQTTWNERVRVWNNWNNKKASAPHFSELLQTRVGIVVEIAINER